MDQESEEQQHAFSAVPSPLPHPEDPMITVHSCNLGYTIGPTSLSSPESLQPGSEVYRHHLKVLRLARPTKLDILSIHRLSTMLASAYEHDRALRKIDAWILTSLNFDPHSRGAQIH